MKTLLSIAIFLLVTLVVSAQANSQFQPPPVPAGGQTLQGQIIQLISFDTTKKTSAYIKIRDVSGHETPLMFPATATLTDSSGKNLRFDSLQKGDDVKLAMISSNGQSRVIWAVVGP